MLQALFDLGAILTLIATVGGGFTYKQFKMEGKAGKWARVLLALPLGGLALLAGIWLTIQLAHIKYDPDPTPAPAITTKAVPEARIGVSNTLTQNALSEAVSINLGGQVFTLSSTRSAPNSRQSVTLAREGSYSYSLSSTTAFLNGYGQQIFFRGSGSGILQVRQGDEYSVYINCNNYTASCQLWLK